MTRSPRPWLWSALAIACGGVETSSDDEGTEDGAEETSSSDAASGTDTDEGDSGDTTGGDPIVVGDPEVVLHPTQPMVVDIVIESVAPIDASAVHTADPGVRARLLATSEDGTTTTLRVRGLLPATSHTVVVSAQADGATEDHEVTFTTNAPLLGFQPSFPVEVLGTPAPTYRLFDVGGLGIASLVQVDVEGVVRWHYGAEGDRIWAGLKKRPDGSVYYIRENVVYVLDELALTQMAVGAEDLGVSGFHHDVVELPNGNFVALSNTFQDADYEGLGTIKFAGDSLVEFTPAGELVWEWDTFDHLDTDRIVHPFQNGNPSTNDPSDGIEGYDWTHGNGVIYRAEDDTFLLSLRHQDWLVQIDHASGDVLWTLGPDSDFSGADGDWFHHQHSPQWQSDGSLVLYDNGFRNPDVPAGQWHSLAVRYDLDVGAMAASRVWFDDSEPFLSSLAGDADTMADGHVLITDSAMDLFMGSGGWARLREVAPNASPMLQWQLSTPVDTLTYRASETLELVGVPE